MDLIPGRGQALRKAARARTGLSWRQHDAMDYHRQIGTNREARHTRPRKAAIRHEDGLPRKRAADVCGYWVSRPVSCLLSCSVSHLEWDTGGDTCAEESAQVDGVAQGCCRNPDWLL
jgi:hypothetical protein